MSRANTHLAEEIRPRAPAEPKGRSSGESLSSTHVEQLSQALHELSQTLSSDSLRFSPNDLVGDQT